MILAGMKFKKGMPWERTLTDDDLAAITAPLLVANDPEKGAARVRRHIPSAVMEIWPGIGHDLLWRIREQVVPGFLA